MAKTVVAVGGVIPSALVNALNNPSYSHDPQEDGQLPYPSLEGLGVTAAIEQEIIRAEAAEQANQQAFAAFSQAQTAANVIFSGNIQQLQESSAAASIALADELTRASSAESAIADNLASQQLYVRTFSSLMHFFPEASPDYPEDIKSQSRIVHHRNAAGIPVFADIFFHWSGTYLGSANAGWTIPSSGSLAPEIVSALRELWGIGPSDDWPYPYLHGTLLTAAKSYVVPIYQQTTGCFYSIIGWDHASDRQPFGHLHFMVPGRLLT